MQTTSSSKPIQNGKPFSKSVKEKSKMKKVELSPKPVVFVSTGVTTPVESFSHTLKSDDKASKGKSSEPISRWVPKSN